MTRALSGLILDFAALTLLFAACFVALRVPAVQQGAQQAARSIEARAGARMTTSNAAPGMAGMARKVKARTRW